ncbi:MAG TPA: hypothetical protein VK648_01495 [Gemmatimonadaceae bacterium]|nr:hypothetical protein [Gemmatimonadaceae bacterium]
MPFFRLWVVFIELLDLLRCINAHEETWLVTSFNSIANRFVLEGTLGCPTCSAEYRISGGIGRFGARPAESDVPRNPMSAREREDLATRAGAFLNVTEPGETVVLGGRWAEAAQELSVMTESGIFALNAAKNIDESETVGLLEVHREIPLAASSVQGVAIDSSFPREILSSAVKVVRPGGRIVGPAGMEPLEGLALLARDPSYWVAEKPAEMIPLRRSKPV